MSAPEKPSVALGQPLQVDPLDRAVREVVPEDRLPRGLVRRQHEQGAVEPARPAQGGVDVPGLVRRGDDEHALVDVVHPVELGQQLVHRGPHPGAAGQAPLLPEGVHLVEEQHAGRVGPGQPEDVLDVAFRGSDVHVEDVGQPDVDEVRAHLAGDRPPDEGLAAAGRPVEQHPAAQALAVEPPQLRVAHRSEERGGQPFLDLGHPADVGQRDPGLLDVPGRHVRRWSVLVVHEHRLRGDVGDVGLGLVPVELAPHRCRGGAGGRLGMRDAAHRAAHQLTSCRVPGVPLQRRGAVAHGGVLLAVAEEQLGQVHPEHHVVRGRVHGAGERVDERVPAVGHTGQATRPVGHGRTGPS